MNKNYKSDNRISFITALVAIVCSYGLFFNTSWAVDHVGNYYGLGKWAWSIKGYVTVTLAGGRFGSFIWDTISFLFAQIGVTKLQNEWVMQSIFMVLLALSAKVIYSVFSRCFDIKYKSIILTLLICIAFINPLFVENFVFIGYELGASILCSAYAVKLFTNKSVKSGIVASILLFVSVITYQAHISLFLIWTTAYIYLEYGKKISKISILELVRSYVIVLIPLVADMVIMKIFASYSQRGDDLSTGESASIIKSIIRVWYHIFVTEIDLTTKCFVLVFVMALFAVGVYAFVKNERAVEVKEILSELVYLAAIFVLLNCYYVAIVLVGYTSFYGRIFWPGFAAISMMCLICLKVCACDNSSGDECKVCNAATIKVYLALAGAFFLGLFFFTQTESTDCYIANKLDEEMAGIVQEYIEQYEVRTGNEITTIKARVVEDSDRYQKYLLRNSDYEFAYKMMSVDTLPIDLINYVYDEEYDKHKMSDEEFDKCFRDTDIEGQFNEFSPSKQLVFEGDTLYWAVY